MIPIRTLAACAVLALAIPRFAAAGDFPVTRLADLPPPQVIELDAVSHHVQGIVVSTTDDELHLTSVRKADKSGHIQRFELSTGRLLGAREIQDGERYHPGGICADGGTIWIPVAEYRPHSTSVIERRDSRTLELVSRFEVSDHIGCITINGDTLIGGNWDSRIIRFWTRDGRELASKENPSPNRHQDLKFRDGMIIASGRLSRAAGPDAGLGAVDWLDPDTLSVRRRITGGDTDRGVNFMNEGMDLHGSRLWLLPEDGRSRLFVFDLEAE